MLRREGAYRVYLAVAVCLVAVAPLLRMLFLALLEPAALAWLTSMEFAEQLRVGAAVIVPSGVLLGTVRGPALLTPFETVTLGSNQLPRRVTLRRPFLRSALLAGAAAAALSGLASAAVVAGTGASPLSAAGCVLAAVGLACMAVVASLLGQAVGSRLAWGLSLLLLLAGLSPLGAGAWFASSWSGLAGSGSTSGPGFGTGAGPVLSAASNGATAGTLCLIGVAAASLTVVPRLLDRLRGDRLLLQARRREAAAMSVATGELSGAAASYREEPSWGRNLRAVIGGPRVFAMLVRDAVGALRTPQRAVLGAMALGLAALLIAAPAGLAGLAGPAGAAGAVGAVGAASSAGVAAPVVVAVLGSVSMFLALGSFADGFRHAADAAAGAATFGTPVGEQFLLHAVFPAAVVILVVGAVALMTGGGFAPVMGGLAMVAVRALEAARGHLPPLLLTPMPSEVGDLSVLARLAWQFDSVIIAAGFGSVTMLLWGAGAPVLSGVALVAGTLLLALATRARLRQGRG